MKRSTARVEDSADRGLPRGDEDASTPWEMGDDLIGWMALLLLVALVVWRYWP
jgi:MYXO-CTERM domain-containing protein